MSNAIASNKPLFWTNPDAEESEPTLVHLTPEVLTLAVVPAADMDNVITALNKGEEVARQVIPLSTVIGAEGDDDSGELTVSYKTGSSSTESVAIPFADASKREEFLVALLRELGPSWQRRGRPASRWKVGFWILLPTVGAALITWGLYAEASMIAAGKPPVNWGKADKLKVFADIAHWIEPKIGPTGVLIVGGLLVGLGLLLFIGAMHSPPVSVVLEPTDNAQKSS